jgi:alcohol dehydrogenase
VTDPGIVAAGHAERAQAILENAGLRAASFGAVRENPTTLDVGRCVEAAQAHGADLFVGLGGGSAIDTAKGANFIYTNGGAIRDYWGVGKATRPLLPLIAIPTTAGTGSECQSAALIADEQTHQKMACLDPKATPRVALLDPVLTISQPPRVTAGTGIDAIAHAVETAVTTQRNAVSLMYSREAFRLLVPGLPRVLKDPNHLAARGSMLLGAALAGLAIEDSMLGAAHAAANPLTAHYGGVHGHAVGLMLPHVVRFNGQDPATRRAYAELAWAAKIGGIDEGSDEAWEALIARLEALLNLAGLPRSLGECGVEESKIPVLAKEAAQQWTARFNPSPVKARDFEMFYRSACERRGEGDGILMA